MIYKQSLLALIAWARLFNVVVGHDIGDRELRLRLENVQDASRNDGNPDRKAGQSPSLTDNANFINFCSGKNLMNGVIQTGESCNGVVMGDIPSTDNMVSTIILSPGPGEILEPESEFNIRIQVDNLVAGKFSNPDNAYYAAPQQLQNGRILGHVHVTVQSLGNDLAAQRPPDPTEFVFFKGINDVGDGNGGLSAKVSGGLPPGAYRVCTMVAATNHQPVIMPVAQRGAQDDCQRFLVGQGNGIDNNRNDDDNDGEFGRGPGRGGRGGRGCRNNENVFFDGPYGSGVDGTVDEKHNQGSGKGETVARRKTFISRRFIA